jgi:RNA 2',3'-cyclic 3'-phosphodiesterase
MLRLFVALPIPDDIADKVVRLQRGLEGAKWSPRENLHVTLRFLGDIDERQAEEVDAALGEIRSPPFTIELAGTGTFGGEEPHALWLGLKPNTRLLALQKQCERACRRAGLAPDPRAYTPHMTICYLPRHQNLDAVMAFQHHHALFTAQCFEADRFYLYASATRGPGPSRYSLEAEYPLNG